MLPYCPNQSYPTSPPHSSSFGPLYTSYMLPKVALDILWHALYIYSIIREQPCHGKTDGLLIPVLHERVHIQCCCHQNSAASPEPSVYMQQIIHYIDYVCPILSYFPYPPVTIIV
ncbi:hypothetical protein GLYMA_20G136550v4 [Glycine max]|nr:hypothetical protein GLYMA_20G136550v4 [Glycine max]